MQSLKKIPFFLLLLVVFFCLHGSLENYGFVELREIVILGLVIIACIGIGWVLVWLLTRNWLMSALICFFIALWYLFFGAIYDWLQTSTLFHFLHRYQVLIPALIVLTVGWILFLHKKRSKHSTLSMYLNLLLLLYCGIDGFLLINKRVQPVSKVQSAAVAFDQSKVTQKPNVYYLLFDEYAGYQSLKDSFGFANDSLYHFLDKKGFRQLPGGSNYDFTLFSMSSIFNMQYIDTAGITGTTLQNDLQMRTNEIRYGSVFGLFESMGYHIENYSIFDIGNRHSVSDKNDFLPVHSRLLTDKILHNRIIRTSGWLFKTGKFALPAWKKNYLYQHDATNIFSEKMVKQTAADKSSVPTFCYAHFIIPHGPFYRDSTGRYNSDASIADEATLTNKAAYLSYLKYGNRVIESLVENITTQDPQAIIVLMSDHGFRPYKNPARFIPFCFDNICAVRFPNNNYGAADEQHSAVNFFRYLFNQQFGQQFPYLPDRMSIVYDRNVEVK